MPGPNSKKSVYFAKGEEHLKTWAENRPGGYSVYIKRLIIQDLEGNREKSIIYESLLEFVRSAEFRGALINILSDLSDRCVCQEKSNHISVDEAADIINLINGI